jgi:hypothetical protein
MGRVTHIRKQALSISAPHRDVECTYDVVTADNGEKLLQLDTYGSATRQVPGKKSQSIRFSPSALAELKAIIRDNNL